MIALFTRVSGEPGPGHNRIGGFPRRRLSARGFCCCTYLERLWMQTSSASKITPTAAAIAAPIGRALPTLRARRAPQARAADCVAVELAVPEFVEQDPEGRFESEEAERE